MLIGFPLLLRSVGVSTGSWPRSWTGLEGLNNSLSFAAAGRWAVATPKPKAGKAPIAAAINSTDLMARKRQFPLISILLEYRKPLFRNSKMIILASVQLSFIQRRQALENR
jgi:hypothetical protein